MKRVLAVALLGALLLPFAPAGAFLNSGCTATTYRGVRIVHKRPKHASGTADVVEKRRIDAYTLTLKGAGDHYFAVEGAGDIDLQVCKWYPSISRWKMVCDSHNLPGMPDGCLAKDRELNGNNPGIGKPLPGPGRYRAFLFNCSGTTACDGLPEEAPVPYVATWR